MSKAKAKHVVSRTTLTDSLNRKFCVITYDDGSKETKIERKNKKQGVDSSTTY